MSRAIAMVMGAWVCYCAMIGSYGGAMFLLFVYVLAIVLDPFEARKHKKAAGAGNTDDSNK